MKILIVDDDATLVNGMKFLLDFRNIPSATATSVSNAERLLDEEEISLICTDWNLGDGTGLDVLQYATNKNIPVVFLTGHDEDSYIDKAKSMGAAKYYIKGRIRFDDLIDGFITILQENGKT